MSYCNLNNSVYELVKEDENFYLDTVDYLKMNGYTVYEG